MKAVNARPFLLTTTLLLSASLALAGCGLRGSGVPATETRELDSFDRIEIGGAFKLVVHVEPGAAQKLELTADDNLIGEIETRVVAGELDVGFGHSGVIRPKTAIRVEVWVPSLAVIDASGASTITVDGLHGESFALDLSGASRTTLSGAVEHFQIDSSGAAKLDAKGLQAKQAVVRLSGAGRAEVWASEQLDVRISGAGKVDYWGKPAVVNQEISGSGSLVDRGEP